MEKELQMAKDFVLFSILLNSKKEFIAPDCYKSSFSKKNLYKAIEELKNDKKIIIKKLSNDKMIIRLNNNEAEDFTIMDDSLNEKLDNYNKLKALKVKNEHIQKASKLNTNP